MRKRLREAWELLRELELDHHASHYASLFSGDRTAYIADLKEEELHELLEYLKRFHKPARRRSAGSAA